MPPELRNRIWAYVLSTQGDITPDAEGQDFKWNLEEIHLDIIGVCRQTYAETALLPFALSCFRFRNHHRVQQLLDTTFQEQRDAISRIKVPCFRHSHCIWGHDIKGLRGLKWIGVWCVKDDCSEIQSYRVNDAGIVAHLRRNTGNPDLEVRFLDWRAPDS